MNKILSPSCDICYLSAYSQIIFVNAVCVLFLSNREFYPKSRSYDIVFLRGQMLFLNKNKIFIFKPLANFLFVIETNLQTLSKGGK